MKFNTIIDNKNIELEFSESLDELLLKNKKRYKIDCIQLSKNSYSLILDGKSHYIIVNNKSNPYEIIIDHYKYYVSVNNELDMLIGNPNFKSDFSSSRIKVSAEMPGLITQIFVNEGDLVEKKSKLFILEAMKMENEISSSVSGKINKINYKIGQTVSKGNVIMEINNE